MAKLQQALQQAGLNPTDFNSHSFRIGAATTAAQKGLSYSNIGPMEKRSLQDLHQATKVPASGSLSISCEQCLVSVKVSCAITCYVCQTGQVNYTKR